MTVGGDGGSSGSSFGALAPHWPLTDDATAALVSLSLSEDIGPGDATSNALFTDDDKLTAVMRTREAITLAGLPFVASVFWGMDDEAELKFLATDGDHLPANTSILAIKGRAAPLLTAERTALNMVQHLSGIATLTAQYVATVEGTGVEVLDTRKTTPGLRLLEKYAVKMGGGTNHRLGLYDAIMIKDNHIAAAGSIADAVKRARTVDGLTVQVECDTLDQVQEALKAEADSLLLDNMNLDDLRAAVKLVDSRVPTEASGGVRLDTIRAIAETGIDRISVGRLTQSAPAVDIGLDFGT